MGKDEILPKLRIPNPTRCPVLPKVRAHHRAIRKSQRYGQRGMGHIGVFYTACGVNPVPYMEKRSAQKRQKGGAGGADKRHSGFVSLSLYIAFFVILAMIAGGN